MSSTRHSREAQREALYQWHEGQDPTMYHVQGTQDSLPDSRTLDANASLNGFPTYQLEKYKSQSQVGYSFQGARRGDSALSSETRMGRPEYPSNTTPLDARRSRVEYESKSQVKTLQKWGYPAGSSTFSERNSPRSSGGLSPSMTGTSLTFRGGLNSNDRSPAGSSSAKRYHEDTPRGKPNDGREGYFASDLGNHDAAVGSYQGVGHRESQPRTSRAGERRRSYAPPAPEIPRLPTPDFDSLSHYELDPAEHDFCSCCVHDSTEREAGREWKRGKAKMERQACHARAYISRVTMNERLNKGI